jgi:GNAT superfamily N-acetyltransferase
MLNAQELNSKFVAALETSWDERAMWRPGKHTYIRGVSPKCSLQCLVGTLNAWIAHGGPEKGFHLVPGIAYGPGLTDKGIWHFQLLKSIAGGKPIAVDLTWHQFAEGTVFRPATTKNDPDLFRLIMIGSLMQDASLVERVKVISDNLARNGIRRKMSAHAIVAKAQEYFLQQILAANQKEHLDKIFSGRPKNNTYVTTAITTSDDWGEIGGALTAFTDSKQSPTYNPLSVTFRLAAYETNDTLARAVATFNQGEAELNLTFVKHRRRGRGYGKRLVKEFELLALQLGAISAIIKTPTCQGVGFYEQNGYEERMRIPIHPNAKDEPQFNVWYYKDLRPQGV